MNVFKFHSPNTAFKKIDEWQYAPMHMVFTIKQEDLRHKAKLVINGNVVDASNVNKYSPTVKITSVRLVFLMAVYKKLSIMTSGIMNAFPTAPCREKIWSRTSPEFGKREATLVTLNRAYPQLHYHSMIF